MPIEDIKALTEEEFRNQFSDLYKSLPALLQRSPENALDAYIEKVDFNVEIAETRARAHCHFIALDGNKRPRQKDFARFLATKITDFAIPRSEIRRAIQEASRLGSTAPVDNLGNKARSLFVKSQNSGEGGEALLSLLAETLLGLPQMLTKMVLKTSSQMPVHGCDGIHIGVNKGTGNLALYWGESKLYSDVNKAIRDCFSSLAPFLLGTGGSSAKQVRDLQLLRDGIDFDDRDLENAVKRFLNPDDPMFKSLEYRGLCLIGFNSDEYPSNPNSKEAEQLRQDIRNAFERNRGNIRDCVIRERIQTFDIEVFCLPFPNVDEFRLAFRTEIGVAPE